MKKIIIALLLSFFFLFATAIPVISKDNNRNTMDFPKKVDTVKSKLLIL